MNLRNSFSERLQLERTPLPAFTYSVPARTRKQLMFAILNFFRRDAGYHEDFDTQQQLDALACILTEKHAVDLQGYFDLEHYLLEGQQSHEEFLDCIEYAAQQAAILAVNKATAGRREFLTQWVELREGLNSTMSLAGVGYMLGEGPALVRVDSDAVHAIAIEPALVLIRDPRYASTNDTFGKAIACLRKKDTKEACTYARRALESALKTIAVLHNWKTKQGKPLTGTETLNPLIQLAFENKLIPDDMRANMDGLRPFLEAAAPKATNPPSHGSAQVYVVPMELAEFAVSTVASHIVFMVQLAARNR